jgi:hypothetical protein
LLIIIEFAFVASAQQFALQLDDIGHFRGVVHGRAPGHHRDLSIVGRLGMNETKVCDGQFFTIEEDILRLEITMGDTAVVKLIQCNQQLPKLEIKLLFSFLGE